MSDKPKEVCKYGDSCYRKNVEHLSQFSHPDGSPEKAELPKKSPSSKRAHESDEEESKNSPVSVVVAEDKEKADEKNSEPATVVNPVKKNRPSTIMGYFKPTNAAKSSSSEPKKIEETVELNLVPSKLSYGEFVDSQLKKDMEKMKVEYKNLLLQPDEFMRHKFLVQMPTDFYHFWDWSTESVGGMDNHPENLFADYGLKLVGPFDVLSGRFNNVKLFEPADYLVHYRYKYDPPEFQTIFIKRNTKIHYGYWRDDPKSEQVFIARNDAATGCTIKMVACNIFSAILYFLKNDADKTEPEKRELIADLVKHAKKYGDFEQLLKVRNRKVVCKTFHKGGMSVPYDRKSDIGYRQLQESEAELKKILSLIEISPEAAIENLQPLLTAANIANDEGDFGASLELGINLFCHGSKNLHSIILVLMTNAYMLVKRPQFVAIIKVNVKCSLNIVSLKLF